MTALSTGLHFDVPESVYRADAGLNQSLLKAFGKAKSPAHFRYDQEHPKEETDSLRIGSYVDCALFRIKELTQQFTAWPEERRGAAWHTFKSAQAGKVILNGAELDRASGAVAAIINHDDSQKLFPACNKQVAAIAEHPKLKIRMKALIDLLPDPAHCDPLLLEYAFDLKTAADASPEGFAKACYEFGYDIQAAFYSDILNLLGRNIKTFGFIVVENRPPHLVKIHYLSNDSREIRRARERYQQWAIAYLDCLKHDHWNGYAESWSEITFKPWMLRDEAYVGDSLE